MSAGEKMIEENKKIFCTNCGTQLPHDANFCYKCGQPQKSNTQSDSSMTSSIILERCKAYGGSAIPFEIYLDDQYAGYIKNGATTKISVSPGEHKIYLEFKDTKSDLLVIRLNPSQEVKLICGLKGFSNPSPYIKMF